jgi:hypothetical protein
MTYWLEKAEDRHDAAAQHATTRSIPIVMLYTIPLELDSPRVSCDRVVASRDNPAGHRVTGQTGAARQGGLPKLLSQVVILWPTEPRRDQALEAEVATKTLGLRSQLVRAN